MRQYSLYDLLVNSENDLESFSYMEIGKIHRDSLNWESRRSDPKDICKRENPPSRLKDLREVIVSLKKAS